MAEEAAPIAGMLQQHLVRLAEFCREKKLVMIFRASNVASMKFFLDPNFIAKPEHLKNVRTAPAGSPWAGYVVDQTGEPVVIDGKFVHADYDMQGVYRFEAGKFKKEIVDPAEINFVREINRRVFSEKDMVMHGDNDAYAGLQNDDYHPIGMLRLPQPSEKFLICEPNGALRIAEGPSNLKIYYLLRGIPWPYSSEGDGPANSNQPPQSKPPGLTPTHISTRTKPEDSRNPPEPAATKRNADRPQKLAALPPKQEASRDRFEGRWLVMGQGSGCASSNWSFAVSVARGAITGQHPFGRVRGSMSGASGNVHFSHPNRNGEKVAHYVGTLTGGGTMQVTGGTCRGKFTARRS